MTELKFKAVDKPYYTLDGFEYDLFFGGRLQPKDLLEEPDAGKVQKALELIALYMEQAQEHGIVEEG